MQKITQKAREAQNTPEALVTLLSQKPILTPAAISALRAQNNPKTFATAVHTALDNALAPIGLTDPRDFKLGILQDTITRAPFHLHHGDVVAQYVRQPDVDAASAHRMTQWLERSHGLIVAPSQLLQRTLPLQPIPVQTLPLLAPRLIQTLPLQAPMPATPSVSSEVSPLIFSRLLRLTLTGLLIVTLIPWLWTAWVRPQPAPDLESIANHASLYAQRAQANTIFPYSPRNLKAVATWLEERHSILATGDYLKTLDNIAKVWNVDLLLLVAITGQEQNFVPTSHPNAKDIAANPFNVFGSWQVYNTRFEDAAAVATRTVAKLRTNCPENFNPYRWLNRRYAQDPLWWRGVQHFHLQLIETQSHE